MGFLSDGADAKITKISYDDKSAQHWLLHRWDNIKVI
jgi:hypothetical protein